MSVATRRALYGKLAGDTTLNNLLASPPAGYSKSIFYEVAPDAAQYPYVIFSLQADTPSYGMKGSGANPIVDQIWLVKAIDRSSQAGNPGSPDVADQIKDRLDVLLTDASLSISGKVHRYLRREGSLDYAENADGLFYRHAGGTFRLIFTT